VNPNQLLNSPSQLLETLKQQQHPSSSPFDPNSAAAAMANFFSRPLESLCAAAALAAATTATANQSQLNSLLNPTDPPSIASNLNSLQLGNDLKQRFAGVDLASLISAAQQQQQQQFQYPINFQLQQQKQTKE
jgi:hypothetical protein